MAVQNFGSGGGGFQLSPGVNFSEIDLTTITPSVDTTSGGIGGVFRWGPVNERVLIGSELDLVRRFGKPTNLNPETFFTAANFLSYSQALYVVRAAEDTQWSAIGGEGVVVDTAGTITATTSSTTVTGVGTLFLTQAVAGSTLRTTSGAAIGVVTTVANNTSLTLTANATTAVAGSEYVTYNQNAHTVFNNDDYETKVTGWGSSSVQFLSRWTGTLGNSLKVSMCETEEQYSTSTNLEAVQYTLVGGAEAGNTSVFDGANTGFVLGVGSTTGVITIDGAATSTGILGRFANTGNVGAAITTLSDRFAIGDYVVVGTGATQTLKITGKTTLVANVGGANTGVATLTLLFDQPLKLATGINTTNVTRLWEYYDVVDAAPGRSEYVTVNGNTALQNANTEAQKDEVHVVVVDEDGALTGNPGAVLEVWPSLSRATDAKLSDGTSNYFKSVINGRSEYIWAAGDRTGSASATAQSVATATADAPLTLSLAGGIDVSESSIDFASVATAYDQLASPENVDVSLILGGASRGGTHGEQLANYLIDNVAESRKDCVVFISPQKDDVVSAATPDANVVQFRNAVRSTSYAVLDSGYKYQYDKYNDLYRWIPLNGDIAGLCVRTDALRDPWFSPAGSTRGQVKNVLKLAFNPTKAQRDLLYKNGVNPVISLQSEGTILFGDKTLLARPSAFDRINVRRLFIVLEKAISRASKSLLFEFNDEFTRAQFRNLVEPYLRDVQGRRGITDFKVVCDETNNSAEVIDSNRFVGDIYIKPARAINFIQLNFVAVRSGVEFSEIVG